MPTAGRAPSALARAAGVSGSFRFRSAALLKHADELVADLLEVTRAPEKQPEGPGSVSEALDRLLGAGVSDVDGMTGLGRPFALQSPRVCGSLLLHESRVAHLSAAIG